MPLVQHGNPEPKKHVFECSVCKHTFVSIYFHHGHRHDGCTIRDSDGGGAGHWVQLDVDADEWEEEEYNYTQDDFNFDVARENATFGRNN